MIEKPDGAAAVLAVTCLLGGHSHLGPDDK